MFLIHYLLILQSRIYPSEKKKKIIGTSSTNINHKGLQRTANEYAGERRIYKDLISKNEK